MHFYHILGIVLLVGCFCYFEMANAICKGTRVWAHRKHYNFKLLPHNSSCGRAFIWPKHAPVDSRIYGGDPTLISAYPWMAFITSWHSTLYKTCGGSLISRRYVVSAARCFYKGRRNPVRGITVTLGENILWNAKDCTRDNSSCTDDPVHYGVTNLYVPANFSYARKYRDFALLRLTGNVRFKDEIQPICLPFLCALRNFDLTNNKMIMLGWGQQQVQELKATRLAHLARHVYDWEQCRRMYEDNVTYPMWKDQLCLSTSSKTGACYGDEGGPVMYSTHETTRCECTLGPRVETKVISHEVEDVYYLMGVITESRECGERAFDDYDPNPFTRTVFYLRFILDNIKE